MDGREAIKLTANQLLKAGQDSMRLSAAIHTLTVEEGYWWAQFVVHDILPSGHPWRPHKPYSFSGGK